MDQKEFDRCLRNLVTVAVSGGGMNNAQLVGSLELAKLSVANMAFKKAEAAMQSDIVRVEKALPPGLTT